MPSKTAPIRSIARRDFSLRSSDFNCTRTAPRSSKACRSISNFASVLTGVRWASGASQVQPISSPRWGRRMSRYRVEPTTTPSLHRTVAKATSVPACWACSESSIHFWTSPTLPGCGTGR